MCDLKNGHKIKKSCSYETHMTSRMGNRTENLHFITFVTLKHPNMSSPFFGEGKIAVFPHHSFPIYTTVYLQHQSAIEK